MVNVKRRLITVDVSISLNQCFSLCREDPLNPQTSFSPEALDYH